MSKKYKIGVVGSRDYNNKDEIYKYLDSKIDKINSIIISDLKCPTEIFVNEYCREKGIPITIKYPKWRDEEYTYQKGAKFKSFYQVLKESDLAVCWDSGSSGVQKFISIANELKVKVIINKVSPTQINNPEDLPDL